MIRALKVGALALCLVAAGTTATAGADPVPVTPGATAYSAGTSTGTAALAAGVQFGGALGGLLNGLVGPIVDNAVTPLVTALQGSLNSVLAGALGSSSQYTAGTPTAQSTIAPATFPSDLPAGLPSPCVATGAQPCYAGAGLGALTLPGLVSLSAGTVTGYTEQVASGTDSSNPIFARSEVANVGVSALPLVSLIPNPLVSVGAIDAKATCPNSGSAKPTASVSTSQVRLFNGALTLNVLNGTVGNITLGGQTYSLGSLPTGPISGLTLSSIGSSLAVSVPVDVASLLSSLGLVGSYITSLLNSVVTNTLTLTVVIGPGSSVSTTSSSAQAWGLGIGVDLSGSIGLNLLGLVSAAITIPTGITAGGSGGTANFGNMLDARLGYVSCGTVPSTASLLPPALI